MWHTTLVDWFESRLGPSRRIGLDLCCGGGITLAELAGRGWTAIGVDHSPGMLQVARERLSEPGVPGRLELASMTDLPADLAADAVTCLDGALNHLEGEGTLAAVLESVAGFLAPGGLVAFDLYEPHHFAHWSHVTLTDRPGTVVAKRGVWDDAAGHGMLRLSGHHTTDGGEVVTVDQVLESWTFSEGLVTEILSSVALRRVEAPLPPSARKCHSGSCSRDQAPCRTSTPQSAKAEPATGYSVGSTQVTAAGWCSLRNIV